MTRVVRVAPHYVAKCADISNSARPALLPDVMLSATQLEPPQVVGAISNARLAGLNSASMTLRTKVTEAKSPFLVVHIRSNVLD